MKIENEITGEIAEVIESYVGIRLHICSFDNLDYFAVDIEEKEIITKLNTTTKILLKIEHTFEDYMKLIADLGLVIPQQYIKHWIPSPNDKYFCINSTGEVYGLPYYDEVSCTDNKRIENYNSFPTRELAEKAVNLSKLGRLILLWQYSNDCIFYPNWSDVWEDRYLVFYSNTEKKLLVQHTESSQEMLVYFKSKEQAAAFLEMYDKEIKNIIGVK